MSLKSGLLQDNFVEEKFKRPNPGDAVWNRTRIRAHPVTSFDESIETSTECLMVRKAPCLLRPRLHGEKCPSPRKHHQGKVLLEFSFTDTLLLMCQSY